MLIAATYWYLIVCYFIAAAVMSLAKPRRPWNTIVILFGTAPMWLTLIFLELVCQAISRGCDWLLTFYTEQLDSLEK